MAGAVIGLWSTTAAVAVSAGAHARGRDRVRDLVRRPAARAAGPAAALGLATTPGMLTVLMSAAAFGATFGALDVALPAFARDHGSVAAAGVLLSALAAGIGTGTFVYGLRPPRGRRAAATRRCAGWPRSGCCR